MSPASRVCQSPIPPPTSEAQPAAEINGVRVAVPVSARVRHVLLPWFVPLLLLVAITALFRLTSADLAVSRLFYGGAEVGWTYSNTQVYRGIGYLYAYGPWPGVALGVGGLIVGLLSYRWRLLQSWRRAGFFLVAMLAVGPGLMINSVVKPWFQRPRPRHTIPFGGVQPFLYVGERAAAEAPDTVGKSFPSGHASAGFMLLAPAFLLTRRHPRGAIAFLLLGLTWGCVLGLGRVAQGDHFASDVLWSGGIVYLSGLVLSQLFQLATQVSPPPCLAGSDGGRTMAASGGEPAGEEGVSPQSRRKGHRRQAA
ncbi:MAG: phosphatase PAP2 family protein [Planctomycetota bacterium]|nr:phosphatase PAP2 family protein [Planctomycetota bacterium]